LPAPWAITPGLLDADRVTTVTGHSAQTSEPGVSAVGDLVCIIAAKELRIGLPADDVELLCLELGQRVLERDAADDRRPGDPGQAAEETAAGWRLVQRLRQEIET